MLILYPNVITCCPCETDFAFQFKSWICLAFQLRSAPLMLTKHNSTFFSHSISCFTQMFVTLLKKRGCELFHVDFKLLKRFLSTIFSFTLFSPGNVETHLFFLIHLLINPHDLNRGQIFWWILIFHFVQCSFKLSNLIYILDVHVYWKANKVVLRE